MKAFNIIAPAEGSVELPQLMILQPDGAVVIEYDRHRGSLCVILEGVVMFRIIDIQSDVTLRRDGNMQPLVMPRLRTL